MTSKPESTAMPIPNDLMPVGRNAALEFILCGLKSYGRKTGERAEALYLFARRDVDAYQAEREREFDAETNGVMS